MNEGGFQKEPLERKTKKLEALFSGMRDKAILAGWIGGLVLAGVLLWFFTQPVRVRITGEAVNRILSLREDSRRLGNSVPRDQIRRNLIPLGTWYTLENSPGRALVFSLTAGGGRIACVAMVSPDGRVEELIPLNDPGERMLKRLGEGALWAYMRRIEGPDGTARRREAE
jgi:hypothetical protein